MHIKCQTKASEQIARMILSRHGLFERHGFFTTGPYVDDPSITLTINRELSEEQRTAIRDELERETGITVEE